jgi:alginate O-acetyltransferase complex protein AlgI
LTANTLAVILKLNAFKNMTPALRLLLASLGGIFVFKAAALFTRRRPKGIGLPLFLFAWPGVIPDCFRERHTARTIEPGPFLAAWARMGLGAASVVLLAALAPRISDRLLGPAGIAALLLAVHLGICDLLPWLLRWAGFGVPLLFDRPWAARSLAEFWSRRWNLAFVEMNQRLFARTLYRRLGKTGSRLALFALSGLLHELALSFPAGGAWGLPLGYFLLQGALVGVEKRFRIVNRAWTWFWLIATSPWLFHEPFRRALIIPFYRWLHALMAQNTLEWYLSYALYAAAIGHLLILIASFQAPIRLGWKEDVAKLARFNEKIFWVYGLYILLCIVSFAAVTWRLHDEFLAGEPAARSVAGFIATFWTIRVLVDVFWYDHSDWPQGNALVSGHALLTSLFCTLATVYWVAALAPPR